MMNDTEGMEKEGVHACAILFGRMGFVFREQSTSDYGIDAIIELKGKNYLSGKLIAVQIKSGDSYFKETKGDSVVFRGDIKHYNYWINHSLPVIIVLYSPTSGKCIWESINRQTAIKCGKGWKVEIPNQQKLEESKETLQNLIARQSEYEERWTSLVVAKKWMLEAKERGSLILEVEEWVNKSSGRGTFILKTEEDDGTEKELYNRELFGFGYRSYELVIRDLFPWANIEIDEEFYEDNMEEDCRLTDIDLAAMLGIEDSKLMGYSDTPPSIYPYCNGGGEVDYYRLRLTLNQLGKSFLEMEDFLETGECYFMGNLV